MLAYTPGERVRVRDSKGRIHERVAISGPVQGQDFIIVWACHPAEWEAALAADREPDGVPWPAEDVEPAE